MTCNSAFVVEAITNRIRSFDRSTEITFGRNINCTIDIPETSISRNQCSIKFNEDKWVITDLSRHRSTLLNGEKIQNKFEILKSGDKITFQYFFNSEFYFYYGIDIEELPKTYRKRKPSTSLDFDSGYLSQPKKALRSDNAKNVFTDKKKETERNAKEIAENYTLMAELEKYKKLYSETVEKLNNEKITRETVTSELIHEKEVLNNTLLIEKENARSKLTATSEELQKLKSHNEMSILVIRKEKELLEDMLKAKEEANNNMIVQIQDLNERLMESEEEHIRLADESKNSDLSACGSQIANIKNSEVNVSKSEVTPAEIEGIVGLVEVQWSAEEIKRLNQELATKNDNITDLTQAFEKQKQDILDVVDRELLCTICSEVMLCSTTLNCKHTFCKPCIVEWKRKKKECPICRCKIKSEVQPLVIDSFIDKLFDITGGDLKTHREELRTERSKPCLNEPSTSASRRQQGRRTPRHGQRTYAAMSTAMGMLPRRFVVAVRNDFPDMNVIDLTESPITRTRLQNYRP